MKYRILFHNPLKKNSFLSFLDKRARWVWKKRREKKVVYSHHTLIRRCIIVMKLYRKKRKLWRVKEKWLRIRGWGWSGGVENEHRSITFQVYYEFLQGTNFNTVFFIPLLRHLCEQSVELCLPSLPQELFVMKQRDMFVHVFFSSLVISCLL